MGTVTKGQINRSDLDLYDGVNETVTRKNSTGGTTTRRPISNVVDILSVYGSSYTAANDSTMATAVQTIGSRKTTIELFPTTWTIDSDLTIPANIALRIPSGAMINVTSGNTLTLNCKVIAGDYQIFDGEGTVTGAIKAKEIPDVWWGAEGGGNDDTKAMQAAVTCSGLSGNPAVWTQNDSRVSVTKGTNDKYGIKVESSKVTIIGRPGSSVRRLSSDISTYALSFPILLIGKPDSNLDGDQIKKIKIKDVNFVGEDTRHSTNGSALMDGRQAVWVKNSKNVRFINCEFEDIDSGAIYCQSPGEYDYENSQYYNTTKCYDIKVLSSDFEAESHSTAGRARLHAIVARVDGFLMSNCTFKWCDDALSCTTTYDEYTQTESDTYTDSNLATSVKRSGRNYRINGCEFYNSSEHCLYLEAMDINVCGGIISVDDATTCNTNQIVTRGRNINIGGLTVNGVHRFCSINTGSIDVTLHGNTGNAVGDSDGGIIGVTSFGLTAYIDGRSDYFQSYKAQTNIKVIGNNITMPTSSQTSGRAMRVYTDSTDANYNTDGQIIGLDISGNTFTNCRVGVYVLADLARDVTFDGNKLKGKPFTEAGFSTGTSMGSVAVIELDDSLETTLQNWTFRGNKIYGFEYILKDETIGANSNMRAPYMIQGNKMDYIKYWDTNSFVVPGPEQLMMLNQGSSFLERDDWVGDYSICNSLGTGTGNTNLKSLIAQVGNSGGDVRSIYDDSNSYDQLV